MRPESTSRIAMPTLASPSTRSDATAGAGWTSLEKSAKAHPSANGNPVRRMAGGISKPFSRLRRAGWEAAVLALLLAGCGRAPDGRQAPGRAGDRPIEVLVANDP